MSTSTDKRPNRYTQAGHAGAIGPGFLLGYVIGVASYLILTLLLTINLLYTLWPGGQWVNAWYEDDNRRAAATAVAEAGGKRLAETLDLLARLENGSGKTLTAAQITKINLDLVYAEELKTLAAHLCPGHCPPPAFQPRLSAELTLALKPSPQVTGSVLATVTPPPPEPWRPLGTAAPTSGQLRILREHLALAKELLLCRLIRAQAPTSRPALIQFRPTALPPNSADCKPCPSKKTTKTCTPPPACDPRLAWQPLPSENEIYSETLEKSRKDRAAYFLNSSELNYLIIVFLFGTLGACLRCIASLTRYVGNRSFRPRWILYYLSQPFLGGGLATAFYVLLRGGFMNTETSAANVTNLYACSAFAVLVGASINEAMRKIQNVAKQFFAVEEPDEDRVADQRSDSTVPIIQNVQLRPDGRSGSVIGLHLNNATKLYLGKEKRGLEVLASSPISILFQVPPDEPPLTQDDLKSVVVETALGASAAHDDTTPDVVPVIDAIQLKPDGRSGTLIGFRLKDAFKLSFGPEKRPLEILESERTPTSIHFQVPAADPALTLADLKSVIVETPAGPSAPYDHPTP